jgi:hypothetical protein
LGMFFEPQGALMATDAICSSPRNRQGRLR